MLPLLVFLALLAIGLLGPLWRPRCPDCSTPAVRVIHWGLPVWFCFEHAVPIVFGAMSYLVMQLPFDGRLFPVSGPYLIGVWDWLTHEHE